ncbi:MAG: glutathione S-transferase family protein [Pseudomonadota bacterium]
MKHQYRLYAWDVSHFSAKLRGYLNFKGLDFEEKRCWLYDIAVRIPRKTGARAMPVLQVDTGEWLADTPLIIDTLERRHPQTPIAASTPRQRMAALLIENWFDDAWPKVSIHTRWSFSENWDNMHRHVWSKSLVPLAPAFVGAWFAERLGKGGISRSRPTLGVTPEQIPLLEQWTLTHLDALNAHFKDHQYLLGNRPTIADYACVAPMYPHLNKDPWPKREWMNALPVLQAWIDRTHQGHPAAGELLPGDQIPPGLSTMMSAIFHEYPVYLEKAVGLLKQKVARDKLSAGASLPRVLGTVRYPMLDGEFSSAAFTYSIWRSQRVQKIYRSLPADAQRSVGEWSTSMGRPDLFSMDLGPTLERDGLKARLA